MQCCLHITMLLMTVTSMIHFQCLQQAQLNAELYGPWHTVQAGIFPAPFVRYPPTHRSADRLRWPKGRTPESTKAQNLSYLKSQKVIANELNQTNSKRIAQAEQKKRERAERELQQKRARGIIKDGEQSQRAPSRNRATVYEVADEDIYGDPTAFPCGRPHSCLFMTLYPGKDDLKPGQIQ